VQYLPPLAIDAGMFTLTTSWRFKRIHADQMTIVGASAIQYMILYSHIQASEEAAKWKKKSEKQLYSNR